ncbi:uncharacterized protein LOC114531039 [Dendronephthya gigantea]|uniref:uncharacterized protein LOC114531039 n=1 Tax=Dendronephthya gigantea TaxID=151771 RepID=UPI00106D75A0|nr:uncharacterized protein LOC114531039 [Dendronephthya gigantea]
MSLRNSLNDDIWKDISELNDKKQRELLKWHLQARQPICKFADMHAGDHLIKKKSVSGKVLYYHHFLCTGSEGESRPTIIHYSNTANNAFRQAFSTFSFGSGSALGQLGIVQEITLPHKDFIESESELIEKGAEVERVVWPEELRRFPSKEVIERARERKDEKYYNLAKNNCESFVMWCLCDWNISLQSTTMVLSLVEIAGGLARTGFQGLQQVPKVVTECVEKKLARTAFGNWIGIKGADGISGLGSIFGVASTLVFEIGNAVYSIYEAKQKWNEGNLIKTREDFIKEVIDTVLLASSRSGSSIVGMFLGQCIIPIPFVGSFIGLLIGNLFGHFAGKGLAETCTKYLASAVDNHTGGTKKLD